MDAKAPSDKLMTKLRELADKPDGWGDIRMIEPADARAILAALPSDAAQAPNDVRIPMDIAIDARRMRTLRRLLDAMDDLGNGFPGAVHAAFQDGGQSTCRALDEAATPEDLIHAVPVTPAAAALIEREARALRLLEIAEPILEGAAAGQRVTMAAGTLLRQVRAFLPDSTAPTPTVAADAVAPSSGMERAFSNEAMCRRDEVALLNRHAETPRLLALLGLPLIDAIALYDVRIRLERALAATETDPGEDAYVAQRMSETLAEVYTIIVGDDEQKSDESLNAIERVKKAAQVLRLEVDLYRAQRDEAATLNGTLLREAFEFTCYVAAAFCSDKQRHRDVDGNVYYIQPTTEDWWNGLRDDLEALQPKLKDALRAPQGAAQ